jgi:hypothetical protein
MSSPNASQRQGLRKGDDDTVVANPYAGTGGRDVATSSRARYQ